MPEKTKLKHVGSVARGLGDITENYANLLMDLCGCIDRILPTIFKTALDAITTTSAWEKETLHTFSQEAIKEMQELRLRQEK